MALSHLDTTLTSCYRPPHVTSPSGSGSTGSGSGTTVTYGEPYSTNLLPSSLDIPSNKTAVDLGVRLTPGKTVQLWLSTKAGDTDSANLVSCIPLRVIEDTVSFDVLAADDSLAVNAFELGLATPSGSGHSSLRMVRGLRPLKLLEVRYLQAGSHRAAMAGRGTDGSAVPRSVAQVRTAPAKDTLFRIHHPDHGQNVADDHVLFQGTVIDEAEVGMSTGPYTVSGRSQQRVTFTNLSTTQDQIVELTGRIPFWHKLFAGTVDVIWEEYLAPTQPDVSRLWVLRTVDIAAVSEEAVTANLPIGPARVAVRQGRAYRLLIRWTLATSIDIPSLGPGFFAFVGVKYSLADATHLLAVTLANPHTPPDASRHVHGSSYARHDVVEREGIRYVSLTDHNTATPGQPPMASFPWHLTAAASNGDPPGSAFNPDLWYGVSLNHYGAFLTDSVDGHPLLRFDCRQQDVSLTFQGALDFDQVTWDDAGTLRTLHVAEASADVSSRRGIPEIRLTWHGQSWFTHRHIGQTLSGHLVHVGEGAWATVPSAFDQHGLEIVSGASLPDLGTQVRHTRYRAGSVIHVVGTGLFAARPYRGARNVVVAIMHGSELRTVHGRSSHSLFRAIHTNTLGEGALDNEHGIVGVAIQKRLPDTTDRWSVSVLVKHAHTGPLDGSVNRKVTMTGGPLTTPVTLTLAPTTAAFQAADNGLVTQYQTTTFTAEQTSELVKVAEGDQLTWTLTTVMDHPANFIPALAWEPLEVEGWVQEMTRLPVQQRLEYQVRAGLPTITADTPVVVGAFARLNGKLVEGQAGRAAMASTERYQVHIRLFRTRAVTDTRVYDASHGSKSGDTLGLITGLTFTRAGVRAGTKHDYITSPVIDLSVRAGLLGPPHFPRLPSAFKLVYTDAAGATRTFLLVDAHEETPDGSRVYQFMASLRIAGNATLDYRLPTRAIAFQLFYGTAGSGANTEANTSTQVVLNAAAGQAAVAARWASREGLYPDSTCNLLAATYEATDTELQSAPYNDFIAYQAGRTLAGAKGVQMVWEGLADYSSLSSVLTRTNSRSCIVREFHFHHVGFPDSHPIFIAEGALPWGSQDSVKSFAIALRLTDMLILQLPSRQSTKTGKLIAMYPLY